MNQKQTKLEELKKLYGFSTASIKWIPEGGDLLRYIGLEVVFVDFKKDDKGEWSSTFKPAKILNINDYDPISMTYNIKYQLDGEDGWKEERIIPEGFSFDIAGAGIQNTMNRFIPESMHLACIEEDQFYKRLFELHAKRDTLTTQALQSISSSKEQYKTLKYACNIGAVCKTVDGFTLYFRVCGLKLRHQKGKTYELTLIDTAKHSYVINGITDDDKSYKWRVGGEEIGELKLIDLQGLND